MEHPPIWVFQPTKRTSAVASCLGHPILVTCPFSNSCYYAWMHALGCLHCYSMTIAQHAAAGASSEHIQGPRVSCSAAPCHGWLGGCIDSHNPVVPLFARVLWPRQSGWQQATSCTLVRAPQSRGTCRWHSYTRQLARGCTSKAAHMMVANSSPRERHTPGCRVLWLSALGSHCPDGFAGGATSLWVAVLRLACVVFLPSFALGCGLRVGLCVSASPQRCKWRAN